MVTPPNLRVLYIFRERKLPLLARWQAGEEPDTLLFGFNHLQEHGIHAGVYEPAYGPVGRALAAQLGRLGPDLLQLRTLPQFTRHDIVFLTAGWPLLLLARRFLRRPPRLIWLNLSLSTLLGGGRWASGLELSHRAPPTAPPQHFRTSALPRFRASALPHFRASLLLHALRQADRVVCVSRAQQAWLAEAAGLAESRLPFISSGVDAAFHTPAAAPVDDGYVLAAGRDPGRDYATLLEAARGLKRRVRIVASPANLRGLAVPGGIEVRYNVPPRALRNEYRGAACVVIPTHGDGYPHGSDCSGTLVLLDAMATAKPAVITERRSVYDYVTSDRDREALIVKPGDPTAMRTAIGHVLQDPERARSMGAAGRAAVERQFNTGRFAAELVRVFQEALG